MAESPSILPPASLRAMSAAKSCAKVCQSYAKMLVENPQEGPILTQIVTWKRTHPWISFHIDLADGSPGFWMLLGEARSKCDHIRYVPLAEETAKTLNAVYFAKGVNVTTAIEGNTLSEEEVLQRLAGQLELPLSKEYLGKEIDNMISAYNGIADRVRRGKSRSPWHRNPLPAEPPDPRRPGSRPRRRGGQAAPSQRRCRSVPRAPDEDVPELLGEAIGCDRLGGGQFDLPARDHLKNPVCVRQGRHRARVPGMDSRVRRRERSTWTSCRVLDFD